MLFLILFVVWVVAELYVIVRVADAIGVLLTIVLLIAAWPVGTWAMRSEGRAAWRRFNAALAQGKPPGREVVDGALIVLGGGLLILPGFISDIFGLLLLFPPTRVLVRTALVRNFQNRLVVGAGRFAGRSGRGPGAGPGGTAPPADVDGTASEVDPPHLRP
jgi:UPF0716 protein FxsA